MDSKQLEPTSLVVRKRIYPGWRIEYRLELLVGVNFPSYMEDAEDEVIAGYLANELRKFVNAATLPEVVVKELAGMEPPQPGSLTIPDKGGHERSHQC